MTTRHSCICVGALCGLLTLATSGSTEGVWVLGSESWFEENQWRYGFEQVAKLCEQLARTRSRLELAERLGGFLWTRLYRLSGGLVATLTGLVAVGRSSIRGSRPVMWSLRAPAPATGPAGGGPRDRRPAGTRFRFDAGAWCAPRRFLGGT
jgi:hypothetical protein